MTTTNVKPGQEVYTHGYSMSCRVMVRRVTVHSILDADRIVIQCRDGIRVIVPAAECFSTRKAANAATPAVVAKIGRAGAAVSGAHSAAMSAS